MKYLRETLGVSFCTFAMIVGSLFVFAGPVNAQEDSDSDDNDSDVIEEIITYGQRQRRDRWRMDDVLDSFPSVQPFTSQPMIDGFQTFMQLAEEYERENCKTEQEEFLTLCLDLVFDSSLTCVSGVTFVAGVVGVRFSKGAGTGLAMIGGAGCARIHRNSQRECNNVADNYLFYGSDVNRTQFCSSLE